ncbi:MAG: hypothetical protein U9N07_02360 [Euryarchaeota archaeon]|nr:hypothetical protein [Euryarchaeota archaeon]
MQTDNKRDIDHHITTMLNDILAPTNDAELKGVLKTIDVLTDYVELENVCRILEDNVLYRENREIALMAFDILRKMHKHSQNQQYVESTITDEMNETPECVEIETPADLESMDGMVAEVATVEDVESGDMIETADQSEDDNQNQPQTMDEEELPSDFELKAPEISTFIKLPESEFEPEPLQPVPELPDSSDPLDALVEEDPDWDTTINRIKELKDVYVNK